MTRPLVTTLGFVGIIVVVAAGVVVCDRGTDSAGSNEPRNASDDGSERREVDAGGRESQLSPFKPLETLQLDASRPALEFYDARAGDGRPVSVRVGAPGLWPPKRLDSDDRGILYLPDVGIETFGERAVHELEVLARSDRGEVGFWGTIVRSRVPGGGRLNVRRAVLRPTGTVTVRVVDADGAPVEGARVHVSRNLVGFVSLLRFTDADGRATFERVPPGELLVSGLHSDHGPASRERIELAPGGETEFELALDADPLAEIPAPDVPPRRVEVRIEGLAESTWSDAVLKWRPSGGDWTASTPARVSSGVRRWSKRIAASELQLRIATGEGAVASRTFVLDGNEEFVWRPELEWDVDVFVVDEWGTPVEGALVQVWRGDQLVVTNASRGDAPVEFDANVDASYELFGVGARAGEGRATLSPGSRELVLRLGKPLLSHRVPSSRVTDRRRIAEVLGAPLVADGAARLVDAVDPESPARRAGIERGDALLSLFEHGDAWRAVVSREGGLHRYRLVSGQP